MCTPFCPLIIITQVMAHKYIIPLHKNVLKAPS